MECAFGEAIGVSLPARTPLLLHRALAQVAFALRKRPASRSKDDVHATAARLLSSYGNAIVRLAYSYLHNYADAEDVLQETLIRVIKASPSFSSPAHERAYLLKTAANVSKNLIKRNRLRDADELNEQLVAEDREDLSFVWEAVRALPVAQREVIHLFYEEGYKTAEIARILGRNESTVRSDLKRGRDALRAELVEAYDFG